jgi:NADPH:quinone reductase-like Zn-dependent oxidoreductase
MHRFGGPEVLSLDAISLATPQAGEAIIRIEAASVNPVDFKIRRGEISAVDNDQLPYVMGRDFAGTIESLNGDGLGFKPGDKVYGMLSFERGTYAERALVKVGEMAHRPQCLTAVEAAAVPLAALTAWQGLFDQGRLSAGQTVLIHAAAGGVGHLAVQFAKAHGAIVIATASGDGIALVRSLGADVVIDHRKQSFETIAKNVDLVLDLIGGETQRRSWDVIRDGGALISTIEEPKEEEAQARNIRAGHFWAHTSVTHLDAVRQLIDKGKVRLIVQQVFDLAHAVDAHRLVEAGHVHGKIVIQMPREARFH